MTVEAEIGGMWLQAKACQGWMATTGAGEEGLPRSPRESTALLIPRFRTSSLQNRKTVNACCAKPPSLWCFIPTALEY